MTTSTLPAAEQRSEFTDVIVTTEYHSLTPSGGIGTVVEEQRACLGAENTLVLLVAPTVVDAERAEARDVLLSSQLVSDEERADLPSEDQALRSLDVVLERFPSIRTVHIQDYGGIGSRIVQAKRAGLLGDALSVVVHCHGATFYLEQAMQQWFGSSHFGVAEAEKIAIEQADLTVFPSRFLKELYARGGIFPRQDRTRIVPYPYRFTPGRTAVAEFIDTLIFIGKRNRMKGLPLFLESLDGPALAECGIRRVVIVGPWESGGTDHEEMLARLRETFEIVETGGLSRPDMMSLLLENAHRALCVLPYLADNYPLTVLDVVDAGVLPVLARAGGLPEMVGAAQDITLANTEPSALRACISNLVGLPAKEREALREGLVREHLGRQASTSAAYRGMTTPEVSTGIAGRDATVIVPFYETPLPYISELVEGLNAQTLAPTEVIFIDDASSKVAASELTSFLETNLRLPWRVLTKTNNEGLAAARQSGFLAAKTSIVINVDSDDVPLPNFVADIVRGFVRNPGVAAVVPYLQMFRDGEVSPGGQRVPIGVYRPLGEGVIASQIRNQLGHANSGFDRQLVLDAGGWDGANRAMWEDFALYMALVSGGYRLERDPSALNRSWIPKSAG